MVLNLVLVSVSCILYFFGGGGGGLHVDEDILKIGDGDKGIKESIEIRSKIGGSRGVKECDAN